MCVICTILYNMCNYCTDCTYHLFVATAKGNVCMYNYQRKFRNLTSDYTESCCWRSVNQEMWWRRCDTAEMWDMRIWRVGSARNAVFSIVLWLRRLEKSGPKNGRVRRICGPRCGKICTTPARQHHLEVKIVKNWEVRSTFGSWSRQNLHHACAPARFGSQNREKLRGSEHFWKLKSSKFAPRLRATAIWKSKSLKAERFGALLEVEVAKICTTPARQHDLEVKIVKSWEVRSTFGSWSRQNLHHACAPARFGSQNRKKLTVREHFWKLKSPKFAPRLRARTIWKSKSLKHQVLGQLFEVQNAFRVAGAGISIRFKMRGRRRSSWGLQKRWQAWWIWRGSETMCFAWQGQGFRALRCRCLKLSTQNPWKGCNFHVTEVIFCSDHFAWQLQDFVCLGSTFSWQAQYFWSIHLKIVKTYWNSEVKRAVNMSFLKEVSQKCFVFGLQSFNFEGSLAQKLRFWASKFHFWRKSRRNASFLGFKASILKEVSHKSFVFELQSFIFEGSLAQKLWISNRLTINSLESQINWLPSHLNLKPLTARITWVTRQLTTKFKTKWQRFASISQHLTTNSLESEEAMDKRTSESQIKWQSKSVDNHAAWTATRFNLTSIDFRINAAHPFPIGSLWLETSATALRGPYVM